MWVRSVLDFGADEAPVIFKVFSYVFAIVGLVPGLVGVVCLIASILFLKGYKPTRTLRYDGQRLYLRYAMGPLGFY